MAVCRSGCRLLRPVLLSNVLSNTPFIHQAALTRALRVEAWACGARITVQ
jgi:hypothetical protein